MQIHITKMVLCLLFASVALCIEWYEENNPHFINDKQLQQQLKNQHGTIKIIKYFTPWCKYCRYMKGFFDGYRDTHPIDEHLKIYEFNCMDTNMRACGYTYHVTGFPTIIVYNEQGKQHTRFSGMYPEQVVYDFLTDTNKLAIKLGQKLSKQVKPSEPEATVNTPKQQTKQSQNNQPTNPNNAQTTKQSQPKPQEQSPQTPKPKQQQKVEPTQSLKLDSQKIQQTEQQSENIKQQNILLKNDSSSTLVVVLKYIGYIVGGVIAGYYAMHVIYLKKTDGHLNKEEQQRRKFVDMVEIEPGQMTQGVQQIDRDQPEIKIDDIDDENL